MGAVKAKIEELVDQLQENNQTILLQKLQLTSLNEEYLTLVNMDNQQNYIFKWVARAINCQLFITEI